jgi:cytochrome b6-f complex iron-sulfur subunit
MQRRDFLYEMSALAAIACTGYISACSKPYVRPSAPRINNIPPTTGNSATLDLASEIPNSGDSVLKNGILIVRLSSGNSASSFTAVQSSCTYEKVPIAYSAFQGLFYCSTHSCRFSISGNVLRGPARFPLRTYVIKINGSILTAG